MANEPTKKTPQDALDAKLAELDAKMNAMLDLEERLNASARQSGGIDAGQLEKILTKVTEAAAGPSQVLAAKLKPENADHLHVSPFEHPEGGLKYPKPEFHREIHWGRPLSKDELSFAEILAVNALSASLARSQKRIARDGKWSATVSDDNKTVAIKVPVKSIDDRQDLPPFIQIVQELTTGERALDAADVLAELTLLKARVAEMDAARA